MAKPGQRWWMLAALAGLCANALACGEDSGPGADGGVDVPSEVVAEDGGPDAEAAADGEASEEDGALEATDVEPDIDVLPEADVPPDVVPEADAGEEADADGEDGTVDVELDGTEPRCLGDVSFVVVDVSVGELQAAIVAGEALTVIDVREPSETAGGIIEGALLYPWTSGVLRSDHAMLPGGPLFMICGSGMRSAAAAAFLVENGHTCVHNVLGGMGAWRAAGYPTVAP